MTEQVFCGACGTAMPTTAKFCPSCGTAQQSYAHPGQPAGAVAGQAGAADPQPPPPPPGGQSPPGGQPARGALRGQQAPYQDAAEAARRTTHGAARRVEAMQPGAGELAAQLGRQLSTPGIVVGAFSGLVAFGVCVVAGLLLAILTPDESRIGALSADTDLLGETLRLAVGSTMARFGNEAFSGTVVPTLLLLVPLGASAVMAYLLAGRTRGMAPWARLLWPLSAGVVLALPMLILALVAGIDEGTSSMLEDASFKAGTVLFYSLLWGALGAFTGTYFALRRTEPQSIQDVLPPIGTWGLRAVTVPLRTLGLLLIVTGLVGLVVWEVQTLRDEPQATAGADVAVALVENVLLSGDFAVTYAALGLFAESTFGAVPVDVSEVDFSGGNTGEFSETDDVSDSVGTARIFAYSDALEPYVFVPLLVVLIGLPIIAALYAGFATARAMATPSAAVGAGWGALVGIVWALALVIVRAIGDIGVVTGETLFVGTLLVGTVAGALGGLLAGQSLAPRPPTATAAPGGHQVPYPYGGQTPGPPPPPQPPYRSLRHG